jgi:ribonuclease HI
MLTTNSDGGSRGNPGEAAIGIILRDDSGKIIDHHGERIGKATNNEAEYHALIKALELAHKHKTQEVLCILDSELVVKHLQGKYKVASDLLKPLYITAKELEKNFKKIEYKHVSRWDPIQQLADKIVNKTLDGKKFTINKEENI